MKVVLIIVSFVFIISALAPLSKREEWWIRGFDFPYVQFTFLGLLVLLGWLAIEPQNFVDGFLVWFSMALFIYRLTVILPYTGLRKKSLPASLKETGDLKILSVNVLMSNTNYQGLIDLVKKEDPDVLFLVETNEHWSNAVDSTFSKLYSSSIIYPLDNTYGMMLYSKRPLRKQKVEFLIESDVPSIYCELRLPSNDWIRFYGLHPKPPAPGENDTSTPRDAELVIVGKMAANSKLPVIVAGDMNDVAWSHTTRLFMRISGLLDPRIGRGFYNTFHAQRPFLRWPLDHFFLSHHFRIVNMFRVTNFGSDHFPMMIEITLNPSTHALVEKEYPDQEDIQEAQEKIEKLV